MKFLLPGVCFLVSPLIPFAVHAGEPAETLPENIVAAERPAAAAPELSPLEVALGKVREDYVEAFNTADAAAVAAFYDEGATYSSDSGKFMNGREAIEAGLKKYFDANPGARLSVDEVAVRPVTADVAIQTGLAVLSATGGAGEVTRFKSVYAKRGDAWKIVELDETVLPPADRGQLALKTLEWMIGAWKDSGTGDAVATQVDWTKSQRFIRRSISVKRGDEESMQATEIIGWDSAAGNLRSWIFDSEGGFGEGVWYQEGNRWFVKTTSTLPDGQRATSINIFTLKDDNTYTWESTNREVAGEVLPGIDKVEVVREQPSAK